MNDPELELLVERIREAVAQRRKLSIRGHGSKYFYGQVEHGERLLTTGLAGITNYEPSELVVTARAGTPLAELEAVLARREQALAFEPPRFGGRGTVGGMVAAGLSGPSRAAVGAVRDYVLGARLINGRGEVMDFGGQVMKNVAGYDVSRLLAGSMGTLGLIAEVSLKVLPVAPATVTLRFEMEEGPALQALNEWAGQPLPLNASVWWAGQLAVRLRGAQAAVVEAMHRLGGEVVHPHAAGPFWDDLRDHTDEFFNRARQAVANEHSGQRLWRLSLPPTAPLIDLPGETLIEWGGAQRWLLTNLDAERVRKAVAQLDGHATLFYALAKGDGVFAPLDAPLARLNRQLTHAFDPHGVFDSARVDATR